MSVTQNLIHHVLLNLSCSELNPIFFWFNIIIIFTAPVMPVRFHLYPLALLSCDECEDMYPAGIDPTIARSAKLRTPSNIQPPHDTIIIGIPSIIIHVLKYLHDPMIGMFEIFH